MTPCRCGPFSRPSATIAVAFATLTAIAATGLRCDGAAVEVSLRTGLTLRSLTDERVGKNEPRKGALIPFVAGNGPKVELRLFRDHRRASAGTTSQRDNVA